MYCPYCGGPKCGPPWAARGHGPPWGWGPRWAHEDPRFGGGYPARATKAQRKEALEEFKEDLEESLKEVNEELKGL